jgi:signal transduction histidine kinase
VASQIALSVENAKLFEALKRANEELEQQILERTAALRQTELKLYRSEKIASLSRLVAGVAHEINSPLGALKSSLELLTVMLGRLATTPGRAADETKHLHHLVRITHECVSASTRIMGVVRALSSYSRLEESSFKVANINDGLSAVVKLLDPSIRRQVKVILNLGEIPSIPCHPAMLNEAFMNMLVNACQSIKEEGEVVIETMQDGWDVVVSVRDTGCGIAQEHLDKIFDPGFTTKGVGVGVGLGLALVYSVIQEHQGTIQVASEIDKGTTFTIRLPIKR